MGNFASTLFSTLLGWLRGAAAWMWAFLNDPVNGGFIVWVAENWLVLIILLCAACMLVDLIVYLIRWQPYKVWASFFRRLSGHADQDVDPDSGRIRRRWIHADGTTSIEEVDAAEMPPEQAMTEPFAVLPDEEELSARYARYARPREEMPAEPVYMEEPQQSEPEYIETWEEPEEPAAPQQQAPVVRRRRYLTSSDELPLNYTRPATSEDAPAYHEPYYPPQWKRPADTGSSNIDLGGGSGL